MKLKKSNCKIKDLPESVELRGIKIKIPKKYQDSYSGIKKEMYLYSWWNKGVWLKSDMNEDRVYPLTFSRDDCKELLEFECI
jgi:hypothetical protein